MRWMDLRFKGTCKVCSRPIDAGERGFYDSVNRTVTCTTKACMDADGLVLEENERVADPAPIPARKRAPRKFPAVATAASVVTTTPPSSVAVIDVEPSEGTNLGGTPPDVGLRCPCCQQVFIHECIDEAFGAFK